MVFIIEGDWTKGRQTEIMRLKVGHIQRCRWARRFREKPSPTRRDLEIRERHKEHFQISTVISLFIHINEQ